MKPTVVLTRVRSGLFRVGDDANSLFGVVVRDEGGHWKMGEHFISLPIIKQHGPRKFESVDSFYIILEDLEEGDPWQKR
jgi:hypothetical protein